MHISPSVDLLRRMVTWLVPGGWLVLEEPDFGMWMGDADPVWATSPHTTQVASPNLALSQGRSLLRQVHRLGLQDVGADAEIDIIPTRHSSCRVPPAQPGCSGRSEGTGWGPQPR